MQKPRSAPASQHPLVRALWGPLHTDVQADIDLALKVGVLAAAGYSRKDIQTMTSADNAQLRIAYERLERVAPQIDREAEAA